ncbi:deferrochelatase/peroxidase EfeB, partial [Streptomyces sp. SID10815]|nr:deferrochelatase/peroxidase EfeB [Streptomyces sp. SID10815]
MTDRTHRTLQDPPAPSEPRPADAPADAPAAAGVSRRRLLGTAGATGLVLGAAGAAA